MRTTEQILDAIEKLDQYYFSGVINIDEYDDKYSILETELTEALRREGITEHDLI